MIISSNPLTIQASTSPKFSGIFLQKPENEDSQSVKLGEDIFYFTGDNIATPGAIKQIKRDTASKSGVIRGFEADAMRNYQMIQATKKIKGLLPNSLRDQFLEICFDQTLEPKAKKQALESLEEVRSKLNQFFVGIGPAIDYYLPIQESKKRKRS